MDEELEQFCKNCKKYVGAANFVSHIAFCQRNITICKVCDEPILKYSKEEHEKEYHISVICDMCNTSVKKWRLEKHQEKICPKRLVICEFCEVKFPIDGIQEHNEFCGSRTEKCKTCFKYIMLRHKKKHLEVHMHGENFHRGNGAGEIHQNTMNKIISKTSGKALYTEDELKLCPYCKQLWPQDTIYEHMKSCPEDFYECDLCLEKVLVKDRDMHFNTQCKMGLKKRISSDFYECPLCGETLPETDRAYHEYFSCETLLHSNAGPLYTLPDEKTPRKYVPKTYENATETCMNCKKKIPLYQVFNHKQSCNKTMTKLCAYCEKELHRDEPEEKHLRICEVYNQIATAPDERTSRKYVPETYKVLPKAGKCTYCKTALNKDILLYHEKECLHKEIRCPDCYSTMLLKDCDKHHCKSSKRKDKVSEIDLLSKNLKDLFTDENCWDTVLQVGGKEFKAHRTILIARSSVFSAMFQHDTSEKQTGLIKVPDCDPDTFKEFLEYLYCGKLENISSDCALHLYTISDKYNVQELKSFCAKYLMQNITTENICEVAILADMYEETELFSAVQDFFNKNFKEIVMISVWEDLFKKNFRLANKLLIGKAKVE